MAQILIGYLDPGKPISNKVFEAYVTSTMGSIIGVLSDLKLAHYLKIPPKAMMHAQVHKFIVLSALIEDITTFDK